MKTKLTLIMLLAGFLSTQSQTWSWTEDYLPYPRTGLSATVLDDSIFYSGGQIDDFYNYSSTIDIYDVGEDEWYTYEPQTPGRWQTNAVSVNGMVFIAGGNDFNPNGAWNTYSVIDVFSKKSGEWTVDNLSIARNNLGAVAAGNKVFFAGGLNLVGSNFVFLDVIDIYDTETYTWSTEESLSVHRALVGTAAVGSKVFFAGGLTNLNPVEVSDVVDVYDTETGEWEVIYLSEPRASIAAIDYGNRVYFAGGARSNNTSCTVIDIYNVANSSWENPIYLSSSRIVTALNIYNALIFTGHVDYINLGYLTWENENGIVEVYYPETGTWELSVPNLIPKRTFYAHIAYENRAYYAGGRPNASSPTNIISILDFGTSISDNTFHEKVLHVNPNPFTSSLRIDYNLQHPVKVNLAIYNSNGGQVEVLVNEYQQQGKQEVLFNLEKIKPGIYFCVLKTKEGIQITKMIKL